MRDDERVLEVRRLLFDYVKSPSLRHIRDPHSITKLAQEIVRRLDRGNAMWRKWDGQRDLLAKSAMCCWIPTEELRDFLNGMPGPQLTTTDVAQRLKAFEEESHFEFAKEEHQAGCLAIFAKEKTAATSSRQSFSSYANMSSAKMFAFMTSSRSATDNYAKKIG